MILAAHDILHFPVGCTFCLSHPYCASSAASASDATWVMSSERSFAFICRAVPLIQWGMNTTVGDITLSHGANGLETGEDVSITIKVFFDSVYRVLKPEGIR